MTTSTCSPLLILLVLGLAVPGRLGASVEHDPKIPQLAFAAQELQDAFKETGRGHFQVTLSIEPDEATPEAFRIRKVETNRIEVTGSDATGAMYGGLEVADRLRLGFPIENQQGEPFVPKRGIKFNIPWDARTPSYDDTGDSAQNNIETVWDFEFWKTYLDDLARYRYNVLSLWSTHPYANLVRLEDYPEAAIEDVYRIKPGLLQPEFKNKLQDLDQNGDGYLSVEHDSNVLELVKKMTIDEKIAHWQRVFQYAEDRGIEVYLFHWTVFAFGAIDKHGITEDQTNSITIDYLRQCVREAILTYPNLAGIGVCAGENADKAMRGRFSTENYIFHTFGQGIMDAQEEDPDREVRLIIRRHATEEEYVTNAFEGRYKGGVLDTSVKYAVAHTYSSRRPQEWERRIVEEGWLDRYKVWLNLRNDDIFMHRWGGAGFVREFIKWMPREHSPGFYMGSDGYVWAREFIDKDPDLAGRLEIDKHWYRFRLWGQLSYNNDLGRSYWEAVLKHRFPKVDPKRLYDAWEATSEIIPQLNRSVWAPTDGDFSAEGCMQRDGFLTVDDYHFDRDPMPLSRIKDGPDPQCLSVTDWAKATLAGETPKGLTPLQVADNLDGYAKTAQDLLPALKIQAGGDAELLATVSDIESMAYLGRYYANKMRGAAKLALFRQDRRQLNAHAEAVEQFEAAVKEWKTYAAILSSKYKTSLLARTHYLDWNRTLEEVKGELAEVKKEGDFPKLRFANLEYGQQLPAKTDLRVEIAAGDSDGIRQVKLYLNGLLAKGGELSKSRYAWSSASDQLMKSMPPGWHLLVAIAEDKTGIRSRKEIRIRIGDVLKDAGPDRWKNEIHQVILKDGERILPREEFQFPRLECKLRLNGDGKLALIHPDLGLIFKTWSKDDDGPHFATLEKGQLRCYRGSPKSPELILWESPKPKNKGEGPYQLGITAEKRLIIFRGDPNSRTETVWKSPIPN